jgi:NADPH:quinone reductase-like Zn-dependent oxidoreductase
MRAAVIHKYLSSLDELKISVDYPNPAATITPAPTNTNTNTNTTSKNRLGANQVLVDNYAAALNFFDALMCVGKYQLKPKTPFVLGSEFAGVGTY